MIAGLYASSLMLESSRAASPSITCPGSGCSTSPSCSSAGLVLGLAFGRGGRIEMFGMQVSVRGLYTPVLVLTILVLARMLLLFRAQLAAVPQRSWIWKFAVIGGLACAGPLSPVIYGLGRGIVDGQFVSPPVLWRSSPRGVDLLAYLHPNPNHPLSKWLLGDGQATAPVVFVEYTAAFSLVAATIVVAAVMWARFRPRAGWWWLTCGFMALSFGPFLIVAGMNTHIPGPWALLRYVPVISAVRTPTQVRHRRRPGAGHAAGRCTGRARRAMAREAPCHRLVRARPPPVRAGARTAHAVTQASIRPCRPSSPRTHDRCACSTFPLAYGTAGRLPAISAPGTSSSRHDTASR